MTYNLVRRPTDCIEAQPDPSTGLDTLLTFEVTSGTRFGSWRTRAEAERLRDQLKAGWSSGKNITGVLEFGDVAFPSSAIIAVYLAPDHAPTEGVTNGTGETT